MTAKEDCESLMNEWVFFAKDMLFKHGEFYPYGAMKRPGGEIESLAATIEGEENSASRDILALLEERLKQEAFDGNIIASAIFVNVGNVTPPDSEKATDAIQVRLDHWDSYSVVVLFPYDLDSGPEPVYGDLFAQEGDYGIFGMSRRDRR